MCCFCILKFGGVHILNKSLANKYTEIKKKLLENSFSRMNPNQKEAVFTVRGPLVVLAGAGSGKTTVIINRIVNMITYGDAYFSEDIPEGVNEEIVSNMQMVLENGGHAGEVNEWIAHNKVNPWNILAITFTNKAANELKNRLSNALGELSREVWASTFHSLCARILRIHAERIGYTTHFAIYDEDDSKRLIKECEKGLDLDDKFLTYRTIKYEISSAKDRLIDYKQYKIDTQNDFRLSGVAEIYELYQKRLKESDAMDFDDLIVNTVRLFKTCPDVLEKFQNKFKYILVDEYQDTNYAQYVLIKLLTGKTNNLCVVGDDDQSIYKFRGATIENIINFDKNFGGAKIVRLEQNYRSTKNILNAANAVIENNEHRKGKTLWTENVSGDKIHVHTAYNEYDEAEYMDEIIQSSVAEGAKYSDFAILYRMNSQSNVIEKVFMKSGIPYRILGGLRFYERKEVRDMIAYLSVINNPYDEMRLKRIINSPRRSIGDRTIAQASLISQEEGKDLLTVIRNCESYDTLRRVSLKLESFSNLMDSFSHYYHNEGASISELYNMILEKTGYIDYLKKDKETADSRIENVMELLSNIKKYEQDTPGGATLAGFLEEVSLLSDIDNYDENSDSVVLMTLHSAKGLEFNTVFLPGFEEGIFPSLQSFGSDDDIEEERRLAYVGITRSRKKLYILNSDSRMIFGSTTHNKSSRFLLEIPEELLEKTKSRDWKKLGTGEETPRSALEMRAKAVVSARHFGEITSGSSAKRNSYEVGDKVSHGIFGMGEVISVTPMGGDELLTVKFEVGEKRLMANFAPLTKE